MVSIKETSKPKLKFGRSRFTDLTNSQWKDIKDFFDNGRKRKNCLRTIVNAILKQTRTGCQWRNLDDKYPPWQSVYYYFRKWQKDDTWSKFLSYLVEKERVRQGRNPKASVCAVDSQSVKIGSLISMETTGFDGGKMVKGRKRHLAVDVLGLPLAIHVSPANIHDGEGGIELLWQLDQASDRLELIRGDGHYNGYFTKCADYYDWKVEVTKKPESKQGFVPQTQRWQVERSFGWFNFFRRLSRDFEKTAESSVAFMQLAFIDIILARFG